MSVTVTEALVTGGRRRAASGGGATTLLVLPGVVVLVLFALLPLGAIVVTGFLDDDLRPTLANFAAVFASETYLVVLARTLAIAFAVTVVSIALAWPASWALAHHVKPSTRSVVLGLVIIPYITSQLLLIYGFLTLIQPRGPIPALLSAFGASSDASILYTPLATFLMLVYSSLPTAVLIMYSASESLDLAAVEAARSLGASPWYVFRRVVWPLSASMILVNFTITYVQTVGAFAEPAILGGPGGRLFGNLIADQLTLGINSGLAVSLALVLLVSGLVVVGLVALVSPSQRRSLGRRSGDRRKVRAA